MASSCMGPGAEGLGGREGKGEGEGANHESGGGLQVGTCGFTQWVVFCGDVPWGYGVMGRSTWGGGGGQWAGCGGGVWCRPGGGGGLLWVRVDCLSHCSQLRLTPLPALTGFRCSYTVKFGGCSPPLNGGWGLLAVSGFCWGWGWVLEGAGRCRSGCGWEGKCWEEVREETRIVQEADVLPGKRFRGPPATPPPEATTATLPLRRHGRSPKSPGKTAVQRPPPCLARIPQWSFRAHTGNISVHMSGNRGHSVRRQARACA